MKKELKRKSSSKKSTVVACSRCQYSCERYASFSCGSNPSDYLESMDSAIARADVRYLY